MGFSNKIKEDVLVASGRHCCICHKFCGTKIEVHHIKLQSEGGEDNFNNAIAVCFDCHADMRSYDFKHPKGTKYTINELKSHRDNWYKKIESNIGIANQQDIIETDKKVFESFVKILNWNGSINFIRMLDFHNSFETNSLYDFNEIIYHSENPAFEFINPDLEGLRIELLQKIINLMNLIGLNTYSLGNRLERNEVPKEWRETLSEKYYVAVKLLNDASLSVCDSYDNLIKTSIRKLGIIPESLNKVERIFQINSADDSLPYCPNCSTEEKKFYMSPIPKEFIELENANYECSKCKFKAQY